MRDYWFISDTHFYHENILSFKDSDGNLIRPFSSIDEMNEVIYQNWNKLVKPNDYIYHLGDVTFGLHKYRDKFNSRFRSLLGKKRLTPGNHDKYKDPDLFGHFEKVEFWWGFKQHNFSCTHFPIRLKSLRDGKFLVHGHTHQNLATFDNSDKVDPNCINVCVERRNWSPTNLDTILEEIKKAS